ncbi:RNA methylase family [Phlyctema vagabunda]|uniref:Trimethylguanosine synthase n=1 Tax=Phlyctema vagabunda TaxID=108571 RepID=A0ABR4P6S0_9HELO
MIKPRIPSAMSVEEDWARPLSGDQIMGEHRRPSYPLTDECRHYSHLSEVPWDIQKYWHQRHSIFSAYDDGIYMTDDAWFGVTPEPVAHKVASDLTVYADSSKTVIIDIFAGAGGNAIAFALSERWSQVIAVEKNPAVIACAQNNAAIYGVESKITWVNDDCFAFLPSSGIDRSKTVIFASPPWGGVGYSGDDIFDLDAMQPYSLRMIHRLCTGMISALFLPRNSDLRQIARLTAENQQIDVVQYCMEGASKGLVAYFPAAKPSSEQVE